MGEDGAFYTSFGTNALEFSECSEIINLAFGLLCFLLVGRYYLLYRTPLLWEGTVYTIVGMKPPDSVSLKHPARQVITHA